MGEGTEHEWSEADHGSYSVWAPETEAGKVALE